MVHIIKRFLIPLDVKCMHCFDFKLHLTIHEQVNCIYIGRCIHTSHTYACICAYICM